MRIAYTRPGANYVAPGNNDIAPGNNYVAPGEKNKNKTAETNHSHKLPRAFVHGPVRPHCVADDPALLVRDRGEVEELGDGDGGAHDPDGNGDHDGGGAAHARTQRTDDGVVSERKNK
jgi:hypothetical protein